MSKDELYKIAIFAVKTHQSSLGNRAAVIDYERAQIAALLYVGRCIEEYGTAVLPKRTT